MDRIQDVEDDQGAAGPISLRRLSRRMDMGPRAARVGFARIATYLTYITYDNA